MQFKILGPLAIDGGSGPLEVTGLRRRALLLRLLVSANHPVPDDQLAEDLWDGAPGLGARSTLASHVSLLRQLIGRDRIVRNPGGYTLVVGEEELDSACFRDEVEHGRRTLDEGGAKKARDLLTGALERWRGPALMDAGEMLWARNERVVLDELRLSGAETLVEARLELGEHRELIVTTESAVTEQPFRERRWVQLMIALYRSGRQSEALRAYQRLRSILGEELGIEPSAELVSLENAIILQKPELDWKDERPTVGCGARDRPTVPEPSATAREIRQDHLSNLPLRRTQMVGRRDETLRLAAELRSRRLITLTGAGGIGKSRMALEAAWITSGTFGEGTRWVELAALRSSNEVAGALAAALGILLAEESDVTDAIVGWLVDRRQLIVLDNCEHVLDAVVEVVDKIIAQCGTVTILATSRTPIGVAGEVVWPLRPLVAEEALGLFEERVFEADAGLTITNEDRRTAIRICERVEGVPLAIEIAAARARTLSFADILELLPQEFASPFARSYSARHRSLRTNIEWSYRLLEEDQRHLFASLSVFPAGFDVEAVNHVCASRSGRVHPFDSDLLRFVDHSMLLTDRSTPHTRYRLLEAMRDFGRSMLETHGGSADLNSRHSSYYCRRAADISRVVLGPGANDGAHQFALEWDNIRAALDWSLEGRDLEQVTALVGATGIWALRSLRSEHRMWTLRGLSLASDMGRPDPVILVLAAKWSGFAGEHQRALEFATDALKAPAPAQPAAAAAWVSVSFSNAMLGYRDAAAKALAEAESALAECGDPFVFIEGHVVLHPLIGIGFPERYADHRSMVRSAADQLDNPLAHALVARMEVAALVRAKRGHMAAEELPRALQVARLAGAASIEMDLEVMALSMVSPDDQSAPAQFFDTLSKLKELEYGDSTWGVLELLGVYWARIGLLNHVGIVLGHLEAYNRRYPNPALEELRARFLDPVREIPAVSAQLTRGAKMTRNDVLNFALERLSEQPVDPGRGRRRLPVGPEGRW